MENKTVSKEMHFKKANDYLKGLQKSLEQAGGLSSLWSERTARLTSIEVSKLGANLGITEDGVYSPLASISLATEAVQKVFLDESLSCFKDLAYKITGELLGFDQKVEGVWFDYANDAINKEGFNTLPPTSEQLKNNFVNGNYDVALAERYSMLKDSETNLLLSCHDLQSKISQPFEDIVPIK